MADRIDRLKDDVDDRVKGDAYDRLKDDGENRPKGDGEVKSAHLFVLVHGLWGGPNHMSTIERAILDGLSTVTDDKIVTLKPSSFRFWKTYDGIQVNAERVMTDILYEIETLKEKQNYHVNKISIIGYSLGGLISRYVIGKFYELGVFNYIEPVFFTTFATPHVGVEFLNDNFFDKTANALGQYLFGKSGRQIFITDHEHLLVKMADPNSIYYKGLLKFKKHLLLANVKNDRTVAFFTSFITDYAPFEDWNKIKIEYLSNLPQSRIGNHYVKPKVIDLKLSNSLDEISDDDFKGNMQEATSILRSNKVFKFLIIIVGALFLIPIWIPLVLISSLIASIYSMVKIRILNHPNIKKHWQRVLNSVYQGGPIDEDDFKAGQARRDQRDRLSQHESFKGDTSELTENTMENILYAEERFTGKLSDVNPDDDDFDRGRDYESSEGSGNELNESTPKPTAISTSINTSKPTEVKPTLLNVITGKHKKKIIDINKDLNDKLAATHLSHLKNINYNEYPLFNKDTKVNLLDNKKFIIENLNKIDWIKLPVYQDSFNAHDGIVARRGERTSPKGTTTIYFWISFLRIFTKSDKESTK